MEKLFFYGQMKSLIKYNNTATLYFEMKIFEKCIKFYRQACKIGKENGAQSKFIFKGFERMGPAHKEMGDLKIAKLVFEKARIYLERAQKEIEPFLCGSLAGSIGNFFLLVNPERNDIVYKPKLKSCLQWILQCH